MLQKLNFEQETAAAETAFVPVASDEEGSQSHLLQLAFWWQLAKRRWVFFVIPFFVVLAVGIALAVLWPATFLSQGKILVESQQIPTQLVQPTVTNAAQERIQVIEQRTMTRDNLLEMADKFQLFPDKRSFLSATEMVELMKKSVKIEPLDEPLAFSRIHSRDDSPTIIFTVGFEYFDPQKASQVANDLVTRILNEDLRDRTNRATDTTKFLQKEVQRLQADSAAIDAKIALAKTSQVKSSGVPDQSAVEQLKLELAQKSAIYSDHHPVMQALRRQLAALEKTMAPGVTGPEGTVPLDQLVAQQDNIQKNLEAASAKLAAARMGETLEKDQQSEKLDVIEQPTIPQIPIRPNRPKIIKFTLLLAVAIGGGLVFLLEYADRSIRRTSDLFAIVDSRLIVAIPLITTHAELRRQRTRMIVLIASAVVLVLILTVIAYFFMPPLDLVIAKARVGLFR